MVTDCNIACFFPHMNTSRKLYHNNLLSLEQTFLSLTKTYQLIGYE